MLSPYNNPHSEVVRAVEAHFSDRDEFILHRLCEVVLWEAFASDMKEKYGAQREELGRYDKCLRDFGLNYEQNVDYALARLEYNYGKEEADSYLARWKQEETANLAEEFIKIEAQIATNRQPLKSEEIRQMAVVALENSRQARQMALEDSRAYWQARREEKAEKPKKPARRKDKSAHKDDNPTGRGRRLASGALIVGAAAAAAGGSMQPQAANAAVTQSAGEQVPNRLETAAQVPDHYKLNPSPKGLDGSTLRNYQTVRPYLEAAAAYYKTKIPAYRFAGQGETESNFDQGSVSSADAKSYAQFVDDTWKAYGRDGNHNGRVSQSELADVAYTQVYYMSVLRNTAERLVGIGKLDISRDLKSGYSKDEAIDRLAFTAYNCGMDALLSVGHIPSQAEADASSHVNSEPVNYANKVFRDSKKYQLLTSAPTTQPSMPAPDASSPALNTLRNLFSSMKPKFSTSAPPQPVPTTPPKNMPTIDEEAFFASLTQPAQFADTKTAKENIMAIPPSPTTPIEG